MAPGATNGSDESSVDDKVGKFPKDSSATSANDGGSRDVGSSYKLAFALLAVISVTSLILSIALPLTVGRSSTTSSSSQSSSFAGGGSAASRQEAVLAGVGSFRVEAGLLAAKMQVLASAIATGDLEEARHAYAFSRASYEQIEVLAAAFPETDCNLDCRPYAYQYGDYDPKYYGFHRIEAHLFRDSNTTAAMAFADQLLKDTANLQKELADDSRFSEAITWGGMLGLAREIAYKKVRALSCGVREDPPFAYGQLDLSLTPISRSASIFCSFMF
jgi:Imelysin